jgi:hypothetical protein
VHLLRSAGLAPSASVRKRELASVMSVLILRTWRLAIGSDLAALGHLETAFAICMLRAIRRDLNATRWSLVLSFVVLVRALFHGHTGSAERRRRQGRHSVDTGDGSQRCALASIGGNFEALRRGLIDCRNVLADVQLSSGHAAHTVLADGSAR